MTEQQEGIVEKIWRIFSSMKLGLALLGVIALFAGIGTLIPQTDQNAQNAQAVAQIWKYLGFTHIYSTFWFRLLLGLLCINLIVCSLQRFQGIYNRTYKLQAPEQINMVPHNLQEKWVGEAENLKRSVNDVLRHNRFKVTFKEQSEGWSFIGIKRRWGNCGSFISHISFVVLVIGAFLGSTLGFKGYFMAPAGSTISIRSIQLSHGTINENFDVKINSTVDRYLPNGERDNWYTNLSILHNNEVFANHTISVNHPFTYKGVTFYQASYLNGAQLSVDQKGQKTQVVLQDQGGNFYQAPGTDIYLVAASVKGSSQNTVMLYQVYRGTSLQPVQTGQLNTGQTLDVQGQYKVTLLGNIPYTGLDVKKDPGVPIIWLGCALLLAGLMLSFYWRPMVVSGLFRTEEGNHGELTMGAQAGKVAGGVQADFRRLVNDIQK